MADAPTLDDIFSAVPRASAVNPLVDTASPLSQQAAPPPPVVSPDTAISADQAINLGAQTNAPVPSLDETFAAGNPEQQQQNPPTDPGSMFDRAIKFVTGEGQYDPAIEDLSDADAFEYTLADAKTSLKLAAAYATTPETAELSNIILKTLPGSTRSRDEKNNVVINWRGTDYYVNRPGFSNADAFKLFADLFAFLPMSKAISLGGGMLAKMGIGGVTGAATSGALDVASQALGSEGDQADRRFFGRSDMGEISGWRALAAGGGGMMSEPLARAISASVRASPRAIPVIRNLFNERRFFRNNQFTPAGRKAAEAAKLNADELTAAMQSQFARSMAAAGRSFDEGAAPTEAASRTLQSEFNVPLTSGQRSRNIAQLEREEMTRQGVFGDPAREMMRGADAAQEDALLSAAGRIGENMAPGQTPVQVPQEGVGILQQVAQTGARQLEGQVDSSYRVFRTVAKGLKMPYARVREFPGAIDRAWRSADMIITPETAPMAAAFRKNIARFKRSKGNYTLDQIDAFFRGFPSYFNSAKSRTDTRALTIAKEASRDFLEQFVEENIQRGDMIPLAIWNRAKGLRAEYGKKYGLSGKDNTGEKFVRSLLEDDNIDVITRRLFGTGRLFPDRMSKVVEKLGEILPESEMQTLSQTAWLHIVNKGVSRSLSGKRAFSPKRFATALQGALDDNSVVMNKLFTPAQLAQMRRFGTVVERTITPPEATNPSRSAYTLVKAAREFFRNAVTTSVSAAAGPTAGLATNLGMRVGQSALSKGATRRALSGQMPPPRPLPLTRSVAPALGIEGGGLLDDRPRALGAALR